MSVHPWVLYAAQVGGLLLAMWGSYLFGRWRQLAIDQAAWERLEEQMLMDEVED